MLLKLIASWFDNHAAGELITNNKASNIAWGRIIPFIILHLACGLVFVVGYSDFAVAVATLLYLIRMFAITGFYHRYFLIEPLKPLGPYNFFLLLLAHQPRKEVHFGGQRITDIIMPNPILLMTLTRLVIKGSWLAIWDGFYAVTISTLKSKEFAI